MKKIYLALMCIMSLVIMTACGGSKADLVVDGFEELVEEVEAKKGKLTASEWKEMEAEFNERFEKLGIDDINEDEFSSMQKIKLAGLMLRWGVAMSESASTLLDTMDEVKKEE